MFETSALICVLEASRTQVIVLSTNVLQYTRTEYWCSVPMYCSTQVQVQSTKYICGVQNKCTEYCPRITLYFRFQVKSTKNTKYCTQFPITDFDMLFLVTIYKLELIECLQEYINYKSSEDFFFIPYICRISCLTP